MPKEVVTLSFGSYASFVSAHYWNLQDEAAGYSGREGWSEYADCVDYDTLFSSSEGRNGAMTYRPRAAWFDLAGSSGGASHRAEAAAAAAAAAAAEGGGGAAVPTWSGGVDLHRAAPVARSAFAATLEQQEALDWDSLDEAEAARQQAVLEEAARLLDPAAAAARRRAGGAAATSAAAAGARHWTDFCKVLVSPRTVVSLPGLWSGASEHSLASGWGAASGDLRGGGGGGGAGVQLVEEGVDVVRLLAEACDSLAGFQILVDDQTGFGAYAAAVLAEVVEDFPGRPRVLFSLRQPGAWAGAADVAGGGGASVSTAQMTAHARDELSEALALCRMSELASLYVPLAAPAVQLSSALPYLSSYNPALPFHSSAVLAAAVDSVMLPTRLTGRRTPLGEAVGVTDLHSLVQLLRPAAAGLAALHLCLPCPSLPADLQQLQRQLDTRLRPPHDSAAVAAAATAAAAALTRGGGGRGPAAAESQPSSVRGESVYGSTAQLTGLDQLASLTPGISGRDDTALRGSGASRAESYCLRGARTDAGPASTSAAVEALDSLLLRRAHRMCVRHRCATPMPLAVPLPFPDLFSPVVSLHGDIMLTYDGKNGRSGSRTQATHAAASGTGNGQLGSGSSSAAAGAAAAAGATAALATVPVGPGGRAAGQGVASVGVLTRLQATSEFAGWVRGVQARWTRAAGSAAGHAVLDAWDVARDDAAEVTDRLHELVGKFVADDDDGHY
ncbi:hypothetical protein HXX76_014411 [Chlamydomonas incerta]|uniref:Misato Segment II tubulin-like domain-containing protein n=1 Tax=Chlamydomonas incerta TaxID=51695 RepID=A0A835SPP3_CHLIN|nr:hypothetical protein HXX76_014411 [Chlamydomonas incerta]|eukprot:KAG2424530.1 hypothetical protein HXX76_014411 [Chlamydomonas incerta]